MKRKDFMILLVILSVVGALLFYDQVLAIFRGMSPLEALRTIVTFIMHVAVATIVSYVAYTLPDFVKPWLKALRSGPRRTRRHNNVKKIRTSGRITNDQILKLLLSQQMQGRERSKFSGERSQRDDDSSLDY